MPAGPLHLLLSHMVLVGQGAFLMLLVSRGAPGTLHLLPLLSHMMFVS